MPPPLRNAGLTVTAAVLTGLAAALSLLSSVVYLGAGSHLHRLASANGNRLTTGELHAIGGVALVVGLFFAAICVRAAMAGVVATATGVVVRGLTTSERVPFDDYAGVVPQATLFRRAARPAVVTTDGRVIGCGWGTVWHPRPAWVDTLRRFDDRVFAAADLAGRPRPDLAAVLTASQRLAHTAPAELSRTIFDPPPDWPTPPPGWFPPPGWSPPPEWPAAPPGWQWWREQRAVLATHDRPLDALTVAAVEDQPAQRWLRRETVAVMIAFLVPAVAAAIVALIEGLLGKQAVDNFALPLPGRPSVSLVILILSYIPTAAAVPIGLVLLARTGSSPRRLGLSPRTAMRDLAPAVGLAVAAYFFVILVSLILRPVFTSAASNQVHESRVPAYFVIYAVILAATTAVTEETFVNGYLLTRLAQLGWRPWPAFWLSLALRTSYHVYYGAGLIATIPFGWLVTRSFQKRGRLARPMLAHFLYDAALLTIAVLAR